MREWVDLNITQNFGGGGGENQKVENAYHSLDL